MGCSSHEYGRGACRALRLLLPLKSWGADPHGLGFVPSNTQSSSRSELAQRMCVIAAAAPVLLIFLQLLCLDSA